MATKPPTRLNPIETPRSLHEMPKMISCGLRQLLKGHTLPGMMEVLPKRKSGVFDISHVDSEIVRNLDLLKKQNKCIHCVYIYIHIHIYTYIHVYIHIYVHLHGKIDRWIEG